MVPLILGLLGGCVTLWSTADDWDEDGYTVAQGDCADVDPTINPGVAEIWYDGVDQDCDGDDADADGDGFDSVEAGGEDCWDDPIGIPSEFRVVTGQGWEELEAWNVYPGAADTWYDGVDADCALDDDFDQDLDLWRTAFYPDRDGVTGSDCVDGDSADAANPAGLDPDQVHPEAQETWYDGTDQDCSDPDSWDGAETHWSDYDADGDGYPSGLYGPWDDVAEDCDDDDPTRFPDPSIDEIYYDCEDQDCDGNDGDQDGDGILVEGYDTTCPDTWNAPEFFLHGDGGDCQDDPAAVPAPLNGHPEIAAIDIYPGGVEVWYDGIDSDCAGDSDFDMDQDGHDAADQDNGTGSPGTDCDDMEAAVNPDQDEDCLTEADDDCSFTANDPGAENCTDFYSDVDEDGFGGPATACLCEALPPYEFPDNSDCDDNNGDIFPGADEYCDPVDWDCDTVSDESGSLDALTWFADSDADGFGNAFSTTLACTQPSTYLLDDQDCDDTDAAVNPDATEVCNSTDDDCDGATDEAGSPDGTAYYADSDGDGYGDELDAGDTYCVDPGSGYSLTQDDCDDAAPGVNPGATEVCDGLNTDEDCSGAADDDDPGVTGTTLLYDDLDGDGFGDEADAGTEWCDPPSTTSASQDDCDDGDPSVYPGATDSWYDGVDSDCGGEDDYDQDADGYPRDVDGGDDCDDEDAAINPAATEVCDADLTDEDCDGLADDDDDSVTGTSTWYVDSDGDGAGSPLTTLAACLEPSGFVSAGGDCNDSEAAAYLGAAEICDALDNDCDATTDEGQSDVDGDGTCDAIDPETCDGVDNDGDTVVDEEQSDSDGDGTCDALDSEVCDGLDNDGDGLVDDDDPDVDLSTGTDWYDDGDGDTYGDSAGSPTRLCAAPTGTVADATDCDDSDGAVNPGATEVCSGVDDDCDTLVDDDDDSVDLTGEATSYADADGDGFGDESDPGTTYCSPPALTATDGTDCDDGDSNINPGATEVCDGQDVDCDGSIDEGQADTDADGTCDALDAEECDGADNDGDGTVDEAGAVDALTWYDDADEDGFGDAAFATVACEAPSLTVADDTDCDDTRADVYPGADELCDADDNDCDTVVDEDTVDDPTWYGDSDSDGAGDPDDTIVSCPQPSGYVADADDCDPSDGTVFPGASETEDLVDQDCDDAVDEGFRAVGELVFTEVMATPSGDIPDEQWFELQNVAGKDVALDGLSLFADVGGIVVVAPEGWVLADGELLVFCHDATVLGTDCDYVYGSDVHASSGLGSTFAVDLALGDSFGALAILGNTGTIIDVVQWTPGSADWPEIAQDTSWVLDPSAVDEALNDDGANWCYPLVTDVFGAGDYGTPGALGTCQTTPP